MKRWDKTCHDWCQNLVFKQLRALNHDSDVHWSDNKKWHWASLAILLKLICTVLQSDLYWIQENSWLLCFEACRVKPVCCDIIFLCRVEHNIFYVAKHSRSRFDSRLRSLRRYATRFEVVMVRGLLFQLARVFHISNTSTHTVGLRNSAQSSEQDPEIQSWISDILFLWAAIGGQLREFSPIAWVCISICKILHKSS